MTPENGRSPDLASAKTGVALPWGWLLFAGLVVGLLVLFPPFRVTRLGADGKPAHSGAESTAYDPVAFTEKFWSEQLLPAASRAPAVAPILAAVRADPAAAAQKFGRKVGAGTSWYFFARGTGRVLAVERSRVVLEIDGAAGATVALRTGPVFGNVVRDGCGLLELNRVPGLAEFNALSAELNRRVEQSVQPALRNGVAVGTRVGFAGCAEAPESTGDGPVLLFVPVQAEVIP